LPAPMVWVCARDQASEIAVEIGGAAPALVPAMFGARLPLHAQVVLQKEVFAAA